MSTTETMTTEATAIAAPLATALPSIEPGIDTFLKLLSDPIAFANRIAEIRQATAEHNAVLAALSGAVATANAETVAQFADERAEIAELRRQASVAWGHSQQREYAVAAREDRCLEREISVGLVAARAPIMHGSLAQAPDQDLIHQAFERARRLAPGSGVAFPESTTLTVNPDITEHPLPAMPVSEGLAYPAAAESAAGRFISNKAPRRYRRRAK
jgi:hypothetical protein